jgi:hypothetical protein
VVVRNEDVSALVAAVEAVGESIGLAADWACVRDL